MTCKKPYILKTHEDYPHGLACPCRGCISCRINNATMWSTRLTHELNYHKDAVFITLTYDDDNLPKKGIFIKETQNFIKRLRQNELKRYNKLNPYLKEQEKQVNLKYYNQEQPKLKFFICGEYGDKSGRPHYHAIIYGISITDHKTIKDYKGYHFITEGTIKQSWNKGIINIGTVTAESCQYVTGYVLKKINTDMLHETWKEYQKPYFTASQGLGLQWAYDNKYQLETQLYVPYKGQKRPIPNYYIDKLGIDKERIKKIAIENSEKILIKIMTNNNIEEMRLPDYKHFRTLEETIEQLKKQGKTQDPIYKNLIKDYNSEHSNITAYQNFYTVEREKEVNRQLHNMYLQKKTTMTSRHTQI